MIDIVCTNTGFLILKIDIFCRLTLIRRNIVATINRIDIVCTNTGILIWEVDIFCRLALGRQIIVATING